MSEIAHRRANDRDRKRRQREREKLGLVATVESPETPPLTVEEWKRCLEAACRKGSVQAMRLWREEFGRSAVDGDDPFADLDDAA